MFIKERINEWAYWIVQREALRVAKESGKPPPWHKDQVMANTRWCNVRRMDDKVSKWMLDHWYPLRATPANYLLAALMARMINRPETLHAISGGKPFKSFDYEHALREMYGIKDSGSVVFTNAYIINGASGGPKIEQVLGAIRDCADAMRNSPTGTRFIDGTSMQITANNLHALRGVGSFIAGQVVADLRHVLGDVREGWWRDRMTWAPSGPGSSRGMKYLLGLATPADMAGRGSDLSEKQFLPALRELIKVAKNHPKVGLIFDERGLEAHDIQNTLCETSKFIRVSYGVGRAKNGYDAQARFHVQEGI